MASSWSPVACGCLFSVLGTQSLCLMFRHVPRCTLEPFLLARSATSEPAQPAKHPYPRPTHTPPPTPGSFL